MKEQWQSRKNLNLASRVIHFSLLAIFILFGNINNTFAQGAYGQNNFFGTAPGSPSGMSAPSSSSSSTDYSKDLPEDSNPNAVLPGLNETNPNNAAMGTDFSGDEKRMQKKYKTNMSNAKKLIEKGEGMMSSAGKDTKNPEYKRGKILKETGEKWLVQLKGNNPFPDQQKAK